MKKKRGNKRKKSEKGKKGLSREWGALVNRTFLLTKINETTEKGKGKLKKGGERPGESKKKVKRLWRSLHFKVKGSRGKGGIITGKGRQKKGGKNGKRGTWKGCTEATPAKKV